MMRYSLSKDLREDDVLRASFFDLALSTFGLSFEAWYAGGHWTDRYIPYALLDGRKVVANASVNRIDTAWRGESRRYIQLGTVMTDPAYRGRSLSRRLIETILADWRDQSDAIYLFANDTVLDFYPKFGFVRATERQCLCPVSPRPGRVRRLDLSTAQDLALLKASYEKSNNHGALPMLNNEGLLMFYCAGPLQNCVYFLEDFGAVAIADRASDPFLLYDVFGGDAPLQDMLDALAPCGAHVAALGFSPLCMPDGARSVPLSEDALFVLDAKENLFRDNALMFPLLSHA